jgi:hypothetical protein
LKITEDIFQIHVFKIEGESIVYVQAPDLVSAQEEALRQAPDLTFSPCSSPFLAIAFEGLEEIENVK